MFRMIPVAPSMLASSSGLEIASFAASAPLFSLLDSPMPMSAEPESCMIVHIGEVQVDQAGNRDQVGDALDTFPQDVVGHLEGVHHAGALLGHLQEPVVGDDDQGVHVLLEALDALLGVRGGDRPSNANGLVTTPTVKAPESLAIFATTGAAPVPVPPPLPAVTNTMSAPHRASSISALFSSAASDPIFGSAPAPRPRVIFSPM